MDTLKKLSKLLLLSLLLFLIFSGVAWASGQDSINELIKNGGNVKLSGTYTLTGPITLSSDLKLNGQNLTTITIPDNANWSVWVPLMKGEGLHNITIEGIEFNVNADGNDETPHGRGYYNCIHLIDCANITVRNCVFHDGKGDGLRVKYCKNVKFYNNIAYKLGHDCFYALDSEGVLAWNNDLTTRTNSGLRLWNSKDAKFFCNRISAQLDSLGGNPGIQIEDSKGTMDDISVFANTIYETWGAGIWLISYDSGLDNYQNITINHNRILKDGVSYNIAYTSGITIDGVQGTNISNNVFDGCNNAGILVLDGGQNTKIEKNIITNTHEHPAISQTGTGYGINDRQSAEIYVLNNCFFNNANGDVFRAESAGDDLQNPTTHNTSSGWRWDGSKWLCDYVITLENFTIDNSTFEIDTFENETNAFENETNYPNANRTNCTNDTDLHEIIFVPVNNTCSSKNVTMCNKSTVVCNKSTIKCQSIYDVPLIASIIGCANKTNTNNYCTVGEQSSVNKSGNSTCENGSGTSTSGNDSGTSTCEELEFKLVVIDNSQSETESNCNSDGSTSVDSNLTNSTSAISDTNTSSQTQKQDTNSIMSGSGSSGNGTLSSSKTNFSNTYSASGTFNVTWTATTPNSTSTASTQINANTKSMLTPAVADFTATPISGYSPLRVSFTDRSQYTNVPGSTVTYNFGDLEGTSSERNTYHIYNTPGTYYVTQTVTNPYSPAGGSTKQVVITVSEKPVALSANFNANRMNGVAPLSVTFTDASTGASTYAWDFGDNIGTSTEQNPSYIFTKAGTYDVVLTVSDGKGHSASKHMLITVTQPAVTQPAVTQPTVTQPTVTQPTVTQPTVTQPAVTQPTATPTQLIADFDADSTSGVDSLTVHFTDKSTGATTWQWEFGGNSPIVTTKNAEHTFGVGTWDVNLKVSNGTNIASKSMTITVTKKQEAPIADFTVDRTSGEAPLTVKFSDKSRNAVSYKWDFGDGDMSTDASPSHTYSAEGDYSVTLTVTGSNGDKSTSQAIITVSKPQTSDNGTIDLNSNSTPINSS